MLSAQKITQKSSAAWRFGIFPGRLHSLRSKSYDWQDASSMLFLRFAAIHWHLNLRPKHRWRHEVHRNEPVFKIMRRARNNHFDLLLFILFVLISSPAKMRRRLWNLHWKVPPGSMRCRGFNMAKLYICFRCLLKMAFTLWDGLPIPLFSHRIRA